MKITRYHFIKVMAGCLGYMIIFLVSSFKTKIRSQIKIYKTGDTAEQKPAVRIKKNNDIVSIVPCAGYDPDEVYNAVKKGLDAINYKIKPGTSVLLKPNIIAQNTPEQAATTHPSVIDAVCRIFSENNCRITIGESSAFYQGGGTRKGFETSQIASVAKKYGAAVLPFESTRLRKITSGKALNPFYITEAVFQHDLVVSLPKMKIHRLARYTGAVKNMYGCIPGGAKQVYHKLFQSRPDYKEYWGVPLVDVFEAVNPGLSIMDAVIGLDKDGPAANGEPKFTGVMLFSTNGAALDVTGCRIMGFDPYWVPALREAVNRGIVSPDKITTAGDVPSIPYVRLPDEPPKTGISKKLDDYFFDQLIVEPGLEKKACDKCGACVSNCAVSAIGSDKNGYPAFDYRKCIYCYCCEESCPRKAIYLHGGTVNHLIRGIRYMMKV